MSYSADQSGKVGEGELSRILNQEIFLYLLDLEVKRARRYQDFFCILILNLNRIPSHDNGKGEEACYETLANLLIEELRDSDILGSLGEKRLAALLPYADSSAGGVAKSRFEGSLKYCDFESEGYKVMVDQICFPVDGTDIRDLMKKVVGNPPKSG
jgi:PleD family two-component response regulator